MARNGTVALTSICSLGWLVGPRTVDTVP